MMRPKDIAKTGTEHAIQTALFCWANMAMRHGFEAADAWCEGAQVVPLADDAPLAVPELKWFHAVPNGGSRGDTAKSRAIRGAQLKAEGVKTGVSDIFLPVSRNWADHNGRYSGLMIEMKRPGEKPTLEQVEYGAFVSAQGYYWTVCDDWRQAADIIMYYLWGKL